MTTITAELVKELREKTGAGMMDCKKALTENQGDLETAIDWLRKKGLAAAAKKSGRVASEGLVAVTSQGSRGIIVEVNAETDFVARNETFQHFVRECLNVADKTNGDVEAMQNHPFEQSGRTVSEQLTHLVATIGENMNLRRAKVLEVKEGLVASYMHSAIAPQACLGRIGVLVALESSASHEKLAPLGKQIAMHIAAAAPVALTPKELDATLIERERAIFMDQAKASGRPADIIEKMVEGRLRKYYEEVVLLEQTYVIDGKTKVSQLLENAGKEFGTAIILKGFARYMLGEGIEKEEKDFAAEVAAQLGK